MNQVKFPIYLDHHATTPVDPRVLDEMMPYFTENFGNASSLDHPYGYDASIAVQKSRESILLQLERTWMRLSLHLVPPNQITLQ